MYVHMYQLKVNKHFKPNVNDRKIVLGREISHVVIVKDDCVIDEDAAHVKRLNEAERDVNHIGQWCLLRRYTALGRS